ncbi:MAG: N-acetyltransferase [Deltaproteobacteria bacterium]|nr:N-acetyltransferase [Deltaproteobacteria bacterium]
MSDYFAHQSACVDEGAQVGAGTRIWHYAHVLAGARIGRNCTIGQSCCVAGSAVLGDGVKVQNHVSIFDGTTIEDCVFLGPSCALTNIANPRAEIARRALYEKTLIRRGATVGANATIVCGHTIGRYAFIAAGAVVTTDVPDYAFMLGVPARQDGWVSRHGHRLRGQDNEGCYVCPESGLRYAERDGKLRCIDLDEQAPLPAELARAEKGYRFFRVNRSG